MNKKRNGPLFNREWKDHDTGYKKDDYVPLSERLDWDGNVETLDAFNTPKRSQK